MDERLGADACGVFGVYAPGEDVSRLTYLGLFALQHRGQESAGIAVSDDHSILVFKDLGLVSQVFNDRTLSTLTGKAAIGHVRYSTFGSSRWENAQPVHIMVGESSVALAHNGNLLNALELRATLPSGVILRSTSDSEVIAALLAAAGEHNLEAAIRRTVPRLQGAYSLVILEEDRLIGLRDPWGLRPLALGRLGASYVLSSETCGLDIVGAEYVREVEPGEMVIIDGSGLRSEVVGRAPQRSLCIFEFIYFARPDSFLLGKNVYEARRRMGEGLARESPVEADLVIGVPDSGTPAAIGYAAQAGIPFGEGLIKNRYIGRTFIQPNQSSRQLGIRLKLNPLSEVIKGQRLVVVDDSIVRGNTSRKIVRLLKRAGASEVHFRVSSPPICWPCYYGIDTPDRGELLAAAKGIDGVRGFIEADSLAYLSYGGLISATGCPREGFCLACLDGNYPIPPQGEQAPSKLALEENLEKAAGRSGS